MKYFALVLIGLAAACGGEVPQGADPDSLETDSVIDWRTAELPPYPATPPSRNGHLSATAAGGAEFEVAWPARGIRCSSPRRVLVLGEDEIDGGSVLLELPASDTVTGAYPVVGGDPRDAPEPPAANVGFQFLEDRGASAYQASAGTVYVDRLDDAASGHFAVEIEHIQTRARARVAGRFADVPLAPASGVECARAGEPVDSAPAVPDST